MLGDQQKSMLKITRINLGNNGPPTLDTQRQYSLMLNPSAMKKSSCICYNQKMPLGLTGFNPKFDVTQPETLNFEFVIDGTGVVKQITSVNDELKKLSQVVYTYNDKKHEPNLVRISWGTLKFDGRLTKMDVNYTLFLPNGDPLRAKVTMDFTAAISTKMEAKTANRNSPDLSHMVEVRAGDTLPLLCHRIYNDSSYYPEVAKINKIINMQTLTPGTKLLFPPLR